jgi:uncharacterized protein YigE (DUF2233 family)
MLRAFICSVAVAALILFTQAQAQQQQVGKDKNEHITKATIVKVNPTQNSITLKMKDKNGKEVEKTIELKGTVKAFNEKGEATRVAVFREGNTLYVVERNEQVFELRANPNKGGTRK